MRKIIGAAVACLVACSLFLIVQPAFGASVNADEDTAWIPREVNVSTFQWVSATGTYSFGIFDFGNIENEVILATSSTPDSPFVIGDTYSTSLQFSAIQNSEDVNVSIVTSQITYDANAPGGIVKNPVQTSNIVLEGSNEFGFFFSNDIVGTKDTTSYDYIYTLLNEGQQNDYYELEWAGADTFLHIVNVDDAMPAAVPIPTAMLLLGSGLVGLAGFKRKMDS